MPEAFADNIYLILNSNLKDIDLHDKVKVDGSPKVKVDGSPKVKTSFAKNRIMSIDNFMKFQLGWTL